MSGGSWPELSVTAARRAKEMVPMTAPIVVIVICGQERVMTSYPI
jgi:hypothetical protein